MKINDFISYEQPANYIVGSDQYVENGKTPVLTAGQSFILGYTDDKYGIYNDLPVVIFDDFTTSVQYVDFPFKVKSSAMKILKNKENANIKFCYYLLSWLQEMPPNHKRQWISTTSQIDINLPSLDEQEEIVKKIEAASNIISNRNRELELFDDLIKARFVEMMESTELSDETSIKNITERVKVGFVGTCEKFYTDELGVPMLRTGNITENGIDLSDLKYVTEEFHEKNKKSQIHEGDLLIARHGSNGQANVYTGPEAQCLNAVVIVPNEDIACSVFLAGLINSPTVKAQIEKTLVGSTQHVVNTKSIASLKVKIPNLTVQKQYCDFVKQVDKSKVAVQKALDEAQMLFDSLMQEYFG